MYYSNDKKRIGIIRGGTEGDYYASLNEGGDIILHIFENLSKKWDVVDIFIDKNGIWHLGGIAMDIPKILYKVDLVWNTAHHNLSYVLNGLAIPNINISSFSFLLKNNTDVLEEHVKVLDLKMPKKIVLPLYQEDFDGPLDLYIVKKSREILEKFSAPWIVKTFTPDTNMGIHLAKTFPELMNAIEDGIKHGKAILIEEFIYGKNVDMHSVSGFRGEDIYVFSPSSSTVGQARFPRDETEKIIQITKDLHEHLGVEHYLKSSFVLHPQRGVFVIDVSFSPDLKEDSHFHQACEFVGAKAYHVVEHILERVLEKN